MSNILIFIGTSKRTDKNIQKLLIAIVKKEKEDYIKVKIAISLRMLLKSSGKDSVAQSYHDIAMASELRKATVSDSFNAKSIPSSSTLIVILETMGLTLIEFAKIYNSINDSEILKFNRGLI